MTQKGFARSHHSSHFHQHHNSLDNRQNTYHVRPSPPQRPLREIVIDTQLKTMIEYDIRVYGYCSILFKNEHRQQLVFSFCAVMSNIPYFHLPDSSVEDSRFSFLILQERIQDKLQGLHLEHRGATNHNRYEEETQTYGSSIPKDTS